MGDGLEIFTGSGKSYFILKLIDNDHYMLDKEIHKILYFYNILNSTVREIGTRSKVQLIQGFSMEHIKDWPKEERIWIIIDDHLVKNIYHEIAELFAVHSRGNEISVTLITQNLFTKSGNAKNFNREMLINKNHSVFFRCKADDNQIRNAAKSCHLPYHVFMASYYLATGYKMSHEYGHAPEIEETEEEKKNNAHRYLLFSSTNYTLEEVELRSCIFWREEETKLYWPK